MFCVKYSDIKSIDVWIIIYKWEWLMVEKSIVLILDFKEYDFFYMVLVMFYVKFYYE